MFLLLFYGIQGQVNVAKVDVTKNKTLGKRFGIKVSGRQSIEFVSGLFFHSYALLDMGMIFVFVSVVMTNRW